MLFVMLATWLILSGNPYLGIVIATIGACVVSVDAFVKNKLSKDSLPDWVAASIILAIDIPLWYFYLGFLLKRAASL